MMAAKLAWLKLSNVIIFLELKLSQLANGVPLRHGTPFVRKTTSNIYKSPLMLAGTFERLKDDRISPNKVKLDGKIMMQSRT